jgi:hypothetical protein
MLSTITGGAARRPRSTKKKATSTKKPAAKSRSSSKKRSSSVARRHGVRHSPIQARAASDSKKIGKHQSHDIEYYKSEARKMGVAIYKDGKAKNKDQLARAIAYRKSIKN